VTVDVPPGASASDVGWSASAAAVSGNAVALNVTLSPATGSTAAIRLFEAPATVPRRTTSQRASPETSVTASESAGAPLTTSSDPPPARTRNETTAPGAGFPNASRTLARSGCASRWSTTAVCPSPPAAASEAGAAGVTTTSPDVTAGPTLEALTRSVSARVNRTRSMTVPESAGANA
jgi:hypothetical protein